MVLHVELVLEVELVLDVVVVLVVLEVELVLDVLTQHAGSALPSESAETAYVPGRAGSGKADEANILAGARSTRVGTAHDQADA